MSKCNKKRNCMGCRALTNNDACALRYPINIAHEVFYGENVNMARPIAVCPKPRTFAQLATCHFWGGDRQNGTANEEKL